MKKLGSIGSELGAFKKKRDQWTEEENHGLATEIMGLFVEQKFDEVLIRRDTRLCPRACVVKEVRKKLQMHKQRKITLTKEWNAKRD